MARPVDLRRLANRVERHGSEEAQELARKLRERASDKEAGPPLPTDPGVALHALPPTYGLPWVDLDRGWRG